MRIKWILQLIGFLIGASFLSCASNVKIIKRQHEYFDKKIEIESLDQAEVRLPFEPGSVKVLSTDVIAVKWKKKRITIKALEPGQGKVDLYDEDNVKIGAIKVLVLEE